MGNSKKRLMNIKHWFYKKWMRLFGYKPWVYHQHTNEYEYEQIDCISHVVLEDNNIETIIIPDKFTYPYPPEIKEMLYNYKMSGKTNNELKEFILSQAKVIKAPIK